MNHSPKSKLATSKKVSLYFLLVLTIAFVVLLFAVTNLFTENPFQRKNFMLLILIGLCVAFGINVWKNYQKDKKKYSELSQMD